MSRSKKILLIAVGACVLLGLAVLLGTALARRQAEREDAYGVPEASDAVEASDAADAAENTGEEWGSRIVYNGKTYRRNADIETVLFMGVDNAPPAVEYGEVGTNGRTDTLILILLNRKTRETQLLQISRDTVTEVDVYDTRGDFLYAGDMQITLQYSFGDSPARGAFLTGRTVSELLYGIGIDGRVSLTMDGISVLTDELGGLTFTFPEDCTDVDPSYTAGTTVTLDGPAVEQLIRSRDRTQSGGNDRRMERQGWMVGQMLTQLKSSGMSAETLASLAEPYLYTDLSADTLALLLDSGLSDEILKVPGETVLRNGYDEYIPDDEALKEMLIGLLYEPVE